MAVLTEGRKITELHVGGVHYSYSREAAETIYAGALAAQNADGKAVPASDAAGLVVLGRAETGANAGFGVVIRKGAYLYNNGEGAEALTGADIGKECFVVDDNTVGKVGGTNKVKAGTVLDVTENGVAVLI